MALKERIADEMKAALLGGNRFEGELLRNLRAAILDEEVATGKRDEGLGDDSIQTVIAREVKKRQESARLYRENNRPELAEPEEQEAQVLRRYLPAQMSEDEVAALVEAEIATLSNDGSPAIGKVISAVKSKVGTGADGATIARIAKEKLKI